MFYTWIRYEDEDGNQFDLREDAHVPDGAKRVDDVPDYVGQAGRPGVSASAPDEDEPDDAPDFQIRWIRHRDAEGNQFDLREDAHVDESVTPVANYPVHLGPEGRPAKSFRDLRTQSGEGYGSLRKAKLVAEIDQRNAEGAEIQVPEKATVADLVALLEADDAAKSDVVDDTTNAPDHGSDTGANTTNDAGATGKESE